MRGRAAMPMVRPSGADLATRSAPMLPPAPALLSMITVPRLSRARVGQGARAGDVDGATRRIGQ